MVYRADSSIDEVVILLLKGEHYVIDCYYDQDSTITKPVGYTTDCPIILEAMKHIGTASGPELALKGERLTDYTLVHKLILDTIQDKASLALRGNEKQIKIKYIFP